MHEFAYCFICCFFISGGKIGELTQKLYDTLTGIQWGKLPDTKGWIVPVCKG